MSTNKYPQEVRVRTAPSPTGLMHIGTARAALFNYLFAKHHNGKFIVRIEDTDRERSEKKYETDIMRGLKWLGIISDEDPIKNGPYRPYRQSERTKIYKKYLKQMLEKGTAYHCFHSAKELEEERERLRSQKLPPMHKCEYRDLKIESAGFLKKNKPNFLIRFKAPRQEKIVINDLIRGKIIFNSDILGDFSIAKKENEPLYNFAAAVDDHEMRISHVIRGEDHLPNTPKQILIIKALGFEAPQYAHMPLVLGKDRSKLSKRHGAASVGEYRLQGYLPQALFNFLALLGWSPSDNREFFSREELIREFSLERVQKSGAVFDVEKLDWMSAEYLKKMKAEEIYDYALPFFPKNRKGGKLFLLKILKLEKTRLKKLSELAEKTDYFFTKPDYEPSLLKWKSMTRDELLKSLRQSLDLTEKNKEMPLPKLKDLFLNSAARWQDRGKLLWPLRVALSGKSASPDPFEIMEILGINESQKRIKNALGKIIT